MNYINQQIGCYKIISVEKIENRKLYKGICVGCGKERIARISSFKSIKTSLCPHKPLIHYCLQCGKETSNPKFCNSSCSAQYNNKRRPKKIKLYKHYCKKCGEFLGENTNHRSPNCCEECNSNYVNWNSVTLKEAKEKRKYQVHSRIRELAKNNVKGLKRFEQCSNCGYNKHVEICHIKAIKDFEEDSKISEINNLNNLVGLCPNCHWEFDNGLLSFNDNWLK